MIFVGAVMGEKIAKTMSWTVLVVPILALMEDHINTLQKNLLFRKTFYMKGLYQSKEANN